MTAIRLSKVAPWNAQVRRTYRQWYTQVNGRRFVIEADSLDALWTVWEVDHNGRVADPEAGFVAHAFNLATARLAIEMRTAGKTEAEIREAMLTTPRVGTGRNHPKHVAHRNAWRNR